MAGNKLLQMLRLMALVAGIGAAGGKAAARLGIDGRHHLALKQDALLGIVDIRGGDGGKQRLGIRVQRADEELLGGSRFHQLAQIHDADIMGNMPHHGKVVGDEQEGQAMLLLQLLDEVQDLRLDTSRAETGSSHTTNLGFSARARAMPTRCRRPPSSSWG